MKKVKHYHLLSELDSGSGTHLADDPPAKRKVVLKQLRAEALGSPESLQEFRRTVKKLSVNSSVPVARTVELLQVRGERGLLRYLVREHAEGASLESLVESRGALPPEEAADLVARTARALAAMHGAGVLHGNLTARNVIVAPSRQITLVDYALPPRSSSRPYQAPEVLGGGRLTTLGDLFSLGVLYCRLLTGGYPPSASLPEAALRAAGARADVLLQMLSPDPSRRPSQAAAVASLLENVPPRSPRPVAVAEPKASSVRSMLMHAATGEQPPAPTAPESRSAPARQAETSPAATPRQAVGQPSRNPSAPAVPPIAARAPDDTAAAMAVDWEKVVHLIGDRPPAGMLADDGRDTRKRSELRPAFPQRSSESAAPRPSRLRFMQQVHLAVTAMQFLFVSVGVGLFGYTLGKQALEQLGRDPQAGLSAPAPGTRQPVYTTATTPTAAVEPNPAIVPSEKAPPPAPPAGVDSGMREVPAGDFIFLNPASNKRERVYLEAFAIDRYEVTNAEYLDFTKESGYISEGNWQRYFLPGMERHPVVGISRADAEAFARRAGKRLPTVQEWQKAAGGPEGQPFPWGLQFDPLRCAWTQVQKTVPVDAFPEGQSPYGLFNMAGNVWEWVSDAINGRQLVVGGSFQSDPFSLGTMAREQVPPGKLKSAPDYGFRCAKSQ